MSESRMLTDHDEIRKWVEARGGRPARVKGTGDPLPEDTAGGSDGESGSAQSASGRKESPVKSTSGKSTSGKGASGKAGKSKAAAADADLDAGLLRIDFQEPDDRLEPVEWEMFFATFEERKLALLCGTGKDSRFNKLVKREGA